MVHDDNTPSSQEARSMDAPGPLSYSRDSPDVLRTVSPAGDRRPLDARRFMHDTRPDDRGRLLIAIGEQGRGA
jgi:hypothetical protein